VTKKDAGPIADPWMTLAWMTATAEIVPVNLVQLAWLFKKSTAQLQKTIQTGVSTVTSTVNLTLY